MFWLMAVMRANAIVPAKLATSDLSWYFRFQLRKFGTAREMRTPTMATTTISSIRLYPFRVFAGPSILDRLTFPISGRRGGPIRDNGKAKDMLQLRNMAGGMIAL